MIVAPREIAAGSYVAAGSVVTDDVPAGAIAVGRSRQRNVLGWVLRRRAGTKSAKAAEAAGAAGTMEEPSPASTDPQGDQP
jgi:bifunctional UDP-N-acetylglucosamine pyrophosphorylase/glucosamine-1-phosphate N-acetyltransferase